MSAATPPGSKACRARRDSRRLLPRVSAPDRSCLLCWQGHEPQKRDVIGRGILHASCEDSPGALASTAWRSRQDLVDQVARCSTPGEAVRSTDEVMQNPPASAVRGHRRDQQRARQRSEPPVLRARREEFPGGPEIRLPQPQVDGPRGILGLPVGPCWTDRARCSGHGLIGSGQPSTRTRQTRSRKEPRAGASGRDPASQYRKS